MVDARQANATHVERGGAPESIDATAEPKWRVLIAHPGRQHSHQAALALLEAGYLDCYATGIPVSKDQVGLAGQHLLRKYSLYDEIDIPVHLAKLNMIMPITNRLLARHLRSISADLCCMKVFGCSIDG